MAVKLSMVSTGFKNALARLAGVRKRTRDLRPVLAPTAEEFKSLVDDTFLSSQSPDNVPWEPLRLSTLAQKRRKRYSSLPLVRRGARGLQGQISVRATDRDIVFGIGPLTPYGIFHMTGGANLPRRAFLPFVKVGNRWVAMTQGEAGLIVRRFRDRVSRYVAQGQKPRRGR